MRVNVLRFRDQILDTILAGITRNQVVEALHLRSSYLLYTATEG